MVPKRFKDLGVYGAITLWVNSSILTMYVPVTLPLQQLCSNRCAQGEVGGEKKLMLVTSVSELPFHKEFQK